LDWEKWNDSVSRALIERMAFDGLSTCLRAGETRETGRKLTMTAARRRMEERRETPGNLVESVCVNTYGTNA
jgi:hypothetical protein